MKQKLLDRQQWNMYGYARNNALSFIDPTGKYVCQGNDIQCGELDAALSKVAQAAAALKDDSPGKAKLNAVLQFYGDKDKNDVIVKFGALGGKAEGNADTSKSGVFYRSLKTTITLDLDQMHKDFGAHFATVAVGTVAHEGDHGVNDRARGRGPENRQEEKEHELKGMTTQSYVNEGLNEDSVHGVWTKSGGRDDRKIDFYAEESTVAWCQQGGKCN